MYMLEGGGIEVFVLMGGIEVFVLTAKLCVAQVFHVVVHCYICHNSVMDL